MVTPETLRIMLIVYHPVSKQLLRLEDELFRNKCWSRQKQPTAWIHVFYLFFRNTFC